jgi:tetratricopeptide (TPR) repeat protein
MMHFNQSSLRQFFKIQIFIILILVAGTLPIISNAQNQQGNYDSEVKAADEAYNAKDYGNALIHYRSANILQPSQKYPQDRIDQISKLLNENTTLKNSLFEDAIIKGESLLKAKDYPAANREYRKALEIDPSAQYPKDKLAAIRQVYTDPGDAARYKDAMAKASAAIAAGNYDLAKNWYQVALTANPDAREPRDQILEADKLKAESVARKAQYDKIIAGADKLLQAEKRQEARAEYQKALEILPDQTYAKQRLAEIDAWLSDRKKEQDAYDLAINQADQFYINRDFANARVKYQEALKVKPNARYPKDMLDKTSHGEDEVKSLKEKYDAAIASADNFYKTGDLDAALLGYKSASGIMPGETYPRTKIAEIEKSIGERTNRKEAYDIAIMNGDQALEQDKPEAALAHFKNALSLLPDEKYPSEKIAEINKLLANRKQVDDNYRTAIAAADLKFKDKKYEEAANGYHSALTLKPNEKYPQDKLNEIEAINKAAQDKETSYKNAIAAADKSFGEKNYSGAMTYYQEANVIKPAEKYPKDKIVEINKIYQQQKQLEDTYNSAIALADKLLAAKKYSEATAGYGKALELKPGEKYPQDKIEEINNILAGLQAQDEKYASTVARADELFAGQKFTEAIAAYNEALTIKPAEKYPQQKITEAEGILAKMKALDDNYTSTLASAEKSLTEKKYQDALDGFKRALSLKPAEQYPLDKIAEINGILADLAAKQSAYEAAVAQGDNYLSSQKYNEAIDSYQKALSLKPDETYPASKITEINTILNSIKATDEAYSKAIADADAKLAEKVYTEALAGYKSALGIKPGEKYPTDKIAEINAALAAIKSTNDAFNKAVQEADQLFDASKYEESIAGYNNALEIKPGEKYPTDRIAEARKMIADRKAKQEEYQKAIAEGDQQFTAKGYSEALAAYNTAKSIFPAEKYPVEKIAEINTILAGIKATDDRYNESIAAADDLFNQKKYHEALEPYEQASAIKPAETYPKQQIDKINQLLAEQKKLDDDYAKYIAEGNVAFADKNYQPALTAFRSASELKPSEQYPKDKINAINTLLANIQAREDAYNKAIADADTHLAAKEYNEAVAGYKSALDIKPDEKYPTEKIAEINATLAAIKATNDAYDKAVHEADQLFDASKYEGSIAGYNKALEIKPGEKYPSDRITEARKMIADLKAKQEAYEKAIAEGDKQFKTNAFIEALAAYNTAKSLFPSEKYPEQKIAEINTILADMKATDDKYNDAITNADAFFNQNKYREALEPYERASTIKPSEIYPKQQIEKINQMLAEQKKLDDDYAKLIADADKNLTDKNYQPALSAYRNASEMKPFEEYPKDKINAINKILAEIQARDDAFNKALAEGDAQLVTGSYESALTSYRSALSIKPGEDYPTGKIATIEAKLKEIDNLYNKLLAEGNSRFAAKEYSQALNAFQQASEVKPKEQYPKDKIADINKALAEEKEQLESMYAGFIADGDKLFSAQSYIDARSAFSKASGLKPAEQYPKNKLNEISNILAERAKALKDEYDKAIVTADNLYQQKVLDQAIDAYEKAASIKPDETYPGEMMRKIRQYISDHAIKEVNKNAVVIASGDERKFSFDVIEPRLRKNNYILIHARATSGSVPKVFLNYGRDAQKNGGIVLRTITPGEGADYLVRLAGQDRWYREDNNWISIYTEGSDVEVSRIQISSGDE